jgi:hypothetical protein
VTSVTPIGTTNVPPDVNVWLPTGAVTVKLMELLVPFAVVTVTARSLVVVVAPMAKLAPNDVEPLTVTLLTVTPPSPTTTVVPLAMKPVP